MKLKFKIKHGAEVTLNLPSNATDDSNDESNLPDNLLLTDTQVSRLRKAFANNSSINMKQSKTQLSKMVEVGGFLSVF